MKTFQLTAPERERLSEAIVAILSIPVIDDIEDYVWEAIFAYVKQISIADPIYQIRRKHLFDVVDPAQGIGWSLKAIVWSLRAQAEFELVIQRADILKKATQLGFSKLNLKSDPQQLGAALLQHWQQKVDDDADRQGVTDRRVAILLKSRSRQQFAYYESILQKYTPDDLHWTWTNDTYTGLQGRRKRDNVLVYRWYPNQKQFFERYILPEDTETFSLTPIRITVDELIRLLKDRIDNP